MQKSSTFKPKFYDRFIKRAFDIMFASIGLVLFSPFALICMLAIKLDDFHGGVFFRQERNGKNGKIFSIIKFRTMKRALSGEDIDPTVDTLTGVGKIIRKTSLDEIPQLLNILRGEMSLIGPRPLLLAYYKWFSETELRRFNVRPGLTGLSQINGRANLSWDERFSLDVEYADGISFLVDVRIFIRSFLVVFTHKDVLLENGSIERFDVYRERALQQKKQNETLPQPVEGATAVRSLEVLPKKTYKNFANKGTAAYKAKTVGR